MRISVFGLGYVGCVSAACLAKAGHRVIGVDVNEGKVAAINGGTSPIVEPGLGDLVADMVAAGWLRATASGREAIRESDLALVCVGTPGRRNGRLDTNALACVCHDIGWELRDGHAPFTVVVRSTVLPGTMRDVVIPALQAAGFRGSRLRVAVNPEFLREGSALEDYANPSFTLAGSDDDDVIAQLRRMYADVNAPFLTVPLQTAEMVKYAFNSFHALKVCFANEIGDACDALGADSRELMRVFCMDRKLNISPAYLRPGFAFGGSCLPKDLRALVYAARSADVELPLLSSILPSNHVRIANAVSEILETGIRRVGIVGLSFKQNTDDLRESPMVSLVEALIGKGCDVRVLDRHVSLARLTGANRRFIEEEIPHIASVLCADAQELLRHAGLLVIGNEGEDADDVLGLAPRELPLVDLSRSVTDRPRKRRASRNQRATAPRVNAPSLPAVAPAARAAG